MLQHDARRGAWRLFAPHLMKVAGLFAFSRPQRPIGCTGEIMAKAQKRGNREIRKPKANKLPAAAAVVSLMTRGTLTPVKTPKKRG
jgi:hypothetical protein